MFARYDLRGFIGKKNPELVFQKRQMQYEVAACTRFVEARVKRELEKRTGNEKKQREKGKTALLKPIS
jgi:hypothetical protein